MQHPQLDVEAAARRNIGISSVSASFKRKAAVQFDIDWEWLLHNVRDGVEQIESARRTTLRIKTPSVERIREVLHALFEYTTAVQRVTCCRLQTSAHLDGRLNEVRLHDLDPSLGRISVEVAVHRHFSVTICLQVEPATAIVRSRDELFGAVAKLTNAVGTSLEDERKQNTADQLRGTVNGYASTEYCEPARLVVYTLRELIADARKNLRCISLKRMRELLPMAFPERFASHNDVDAAVAEAERRNLVSKKLVQTSIGLSATNIYLEPAGRQLLSRPHHDH